MQSEALWRSLAKGAGLASAAIGVSALAGWLLDLDLLKSLVPGFHAMKANTALGLTAAGVALWLKGNQGGRPARLGRWSSYALSAFVVLLAALTLAEYASGASLGIDELLFH